MDNKIPVPLVFRFEIRPRKPILMVLGVGPNFFPGVDYLLVKKAVEIIEVTERFGGTPLHNDAEVQSLSPRDIGLFFQVQFPNFRKLNRAYTCIQKELG